MHLRPPVVDDVAAVHAVLTARDIADLGAPDYKLDDLRDEWRSAGFDLKADARVALDADGAICGWGEVRRQGAFAAVAPNAEGSGAGAALLAFVEGRERACGHTVHRQLIAHANASGRSLLLAAGYARARSNYVLGRVLAGDIAAVAPPPDVALRAVALESDGPLLHALDGRAFAGQPGFEPDTLEAFTDEHLSAHDLTSELSLVAETATGIAGFLLSRRREPEQVGHIALLAVHPDEQGRGIGSALLGTAVARFAAAGLIAAELMVSSQNPTALRLYERHGLTELHRFDIYEKPVERAA